MKYFKILLIFRFFLLILCFTFICSVVECKEYHFGTYNIDVNRSTWLMRSSSISNLILYNNFDVFGAQEVSPNQLIDLKKSLKDVYSSFGVGRDDGKNQGEYCPIFYKTSIFKLLSGNTFWLSETPDIPSISWEASHNRICTYVKLKDVRDNTVIWFFNTHLDHKSSKARDESCKLLINKIRQICPNNSNIIITGDFNLYSDSNTYKVFLENELIKDSFFSAKYKWAPTGSFNNNKFEKISKSRIDYIFVSKSAFVSRYGILNNFYFTIENRAVSDIGIINQNDINNKESEMKTPSDHYPVSVFVEFKESNNKINNDTQFETQKDSIKNKIFKKLFK